MAIPHDAIAAALTQVEADHSVRILFACESGSRAWGFPSPDSDYDIRFIYAHEPSWYLALDPRKDTIEAMLPGDLDLAGWDLRKALRLFAGLNVALNEWLSSPILYRTEPKFHEQLRSLVTPYFSPKKAAFHYVNLAKRTAKKHFTAGPMNVKKLFYVLRPLIAIEWIRLHEKMPPTELDPMLDSAAPELAATVRELVVRKQSLGEGDDVEVAPAVHRWIRGHLKNAGQVASGLPGGEMPGWDALNDIAREWIR